MKIRVTEQAPGELQAKAGSILRVFERLTGRPLQKAAGLSLAKQQVLYAPPNADGSRKQCGNCALWIKSQLCLIHGSQSISAEHICGYHVYGVPLSDLPDNFGTEAISPKLSGLELVSGGTSCDSCKQYRDGACDLLREAVEPLACCAAWEGPELVKSENPRSAPQQFDYAVLRGAVKRGKREVERIRQRMLDEIGKVLG